MKQLLIKKGVPFLISGEKRHKSLGGAHFSKKRFYREYALQDGQLITGQNPFSVRAVAKLLLQAISVKG